MIHKNISMHIYQQPFIYCWHVLHSKKFPLFLVVFLCAATWTINMNKIWNCPSRTETLPNTPSYRSIMRLTIYNIQHSDFGIYKCVGELSCDAWRFLKFWHFSCLTFLIIFIIKQQKILAARVSHPFVFTVSRLLNVINCLSWSSSWC